MVFERVNLRKTCKRAVIAATINYVLHFSTIQQIVMNFNIFISFFYFYKFILGGHTIYSVCVYACICASAVAFFSYSKRAKCVIAVAKTSGRKYMSRDSWHSVFDIPSTTIKEQTVKYLQCFGVKCVSYFYCIALHCTNNFSFCCLINRISVIFQNQRRDHFPLAPNQCDSHMVLLRNECFDSFPHLDFYKLITHGSLMRKTQTDKPKQSKRSERRRKKTATYTIRIECGIQKELHAFTEILGEKERERKRRKQQEKRSVDWYRNIKRTKCQETALNSRHKKCMKRFTQIDRNTNKMYFIMQYTNCIEYLSLLVCARCNCGIFFCLCHAFASFVRFDLIFTH